MNPEWSATDYTQSLLREGVGGVLRQRQEVVHLGSHTGPGGIGGACLISSAPFLACEPTTTNTHQRIAKS